MKITRLYERYLFWKWKRKLGYDLTPGELFYRLYDPNGPKGYRKREKDV
jgi:hypothetical protein